MKRKLIKFSNYSFCITLPKKAVEKLGWGKGEEVEVSFDPRTKKIIVAKEGQAKSNSEKPTRKQSLTKNQADPKHDGDEIQPIPKLRW